MIKRGVLFCTALILIGTLDWLTTVVGIVFFGATETNLLLAGLTQFSVLLFSTVKISSIMLTGLLFYKAETKTESTSQISPLAKKFLKSGYTVCLGTLLIVVLNNFYTIFSLA